MPRLSVPLTDEQHTAIKVKAAQVGLTQAEVARRLLFAWLGKIELTANRDVEQINHLIGYINELYQVGQLSGYSRDKLLSLVMIE